MHIQIFTVGGTIDKVYFDKLSEYQVGNPGISDILADLPLDCRFEVESLMRKDSLEMTDDDRTMVSEKVRAARLDKILITHGTDTMIETALQLEPRGDQCVVLTGALQPANFRQSDAVFNIGMAFGVLSTHTPGVHIVMNGCRFDPKNCRKNRDAGRFESLD